MNFFVRKLVAAGNHRAISINWVPVWLESQVLTIFTFSFLFQFFLSLRLVNFIFPAYLGKYFDIEQRKMSFNSDPAKQAQEVIFSKRPREFFHSNLYFNKFVVEKVQTQKHLGLKLDKKLNFKEHLKDKFPKVNRGIGILKKLSRFLPSHSLVTLYKSFIRPHLDYVDIIYDHPTNLNMCNKIETGQ